MLSKINYGLNVYYNEMKLLIIIFKLKEKNNTMYI